LSLERAYNKANSAFRMVRENPRYNVNQQELAQSIKLIKQAKNIIEKLINDERRGGNTGGGESIEY